MELERDGLSASSVLGSRIDINRYSSIKFKVQSFSFTTIHVTYYKIAYFSKGVFIYYNASHEMLLSSNFESLSLCRTYKVIFIQHS